MVGGKVKGMLGVEGWRNQMSDWSRSWKRGGCLLQRLEPDQWLTQGARAALPSGAQFRSSSSALPSGAQSRFSSSAFGPVAPAYPATLSVVGG